MDEILGESPFAIAGESTFENTDAVFREAAEARLDELESELGETPWAGEGELSRPTPAGIPAQRTLATDSRSLPDVTYLDEPWNRGKPGRHQTPEGTAVQTKLAESAAVRLLELGDFDVDDYRLRPAHRRILGVHVAGIADALRRGRIVGPIQVSVQGRTSSSGSMSHNLSLSRNRAVNTATMIRGLARQAGIESQVQVRWTPLGESVSQTKEGDNAEGADSRQVRVQVIAPRPVGFRSPLQTVGVGRQEMEASFLRQPPMRGLGRSVGSSSGVARRLPPTNGRLCFEVLSVRRSRTFAWLRVRGLTTVTARVRVHDHASRSSATYALQGVVLRARSTPTTATAPLPRLTRIARRVLAIAMQAPNPRRACSPSAIVARAGSATRLLSGMAVLVIPPAGSGRALLRLSPRSPAVRLRRKLISVRARRFSTPVMIAGRFRLLAVGARRPGETEGNFEASAVGEWGEAGELNEFTEVGENEWTEAATEAEYGEQNEFGEFAENQWTEVGELNGYGEVGENEWAETEYGEQNEFGEAGESEWTEIESGELNETEQYEFGEVGENEWNEFESNQAEFTEIGYTEQNEYGQAENEWTELGEFELSGVLNEYGEVRDGNDLSR